MGFVDDFKKLDSSSATAATLLFFSTLGPGFLTIFLFDTELFRSLEALKLILLALSFSSPGVIVPIFISTVSALVFSDMYKIDSRLFGSPKEWFDRVAVSNAINLYLLIFLAYIFAWSFDSFLWGFLASIILVCVFEVVILARIVIDSENHTQ